MNDTKLEQLTLALRKAQDAQVQHLRDKYPMGCRVGVFLMYGQTNPSWGRVEGHDANMHGGEVAVRMENAKKWSRYMVRRIPPEMIQHVELAPPPFQRPEFA